MACPRVFRSRKSGTSDVPLFHKPVRTIELWSLNTPRPFPDDSGISSRRDYSRAGPLRGQAMERCQSQSPALGIRRRRRPSRPWHDQVWRRSRWRCRRRPLRNAAGRLRLITRSNGLWVAPNAGLPANGAVHFFGWFAAGPQVPIARTDGAISSPMMRTLVPVPMKKYHSEPTANARMSHQDLGRSRMKAMRLSSQANP